MTTQLSARQVLALNPDARARFVRENLSCNEDGSRRIQNLTGWDKLSDFERGLLRRELLQAVERATASSIDANDLAALLGQVPLDSEKRAAPQSYYPSPSRSSTVEPREDEDRQYEAKCHQALINDDARPLYDVSLIEKVDADPHAYTDLLRPWARHPGDRGVLSRQWARWREFRGWQLRSRCRKPAFEEYLALHRLNSLMHGGSSKYTAGPEFEQVVRGLWEKDFDHGEDQEDAEGDAVERHAEGVRSWLIYQGFPLHQPFGLLANPKMQDQWTTYVEYLAFEAESLYKLARTVRKLQNIVKTDDSFEGKYKMTNTEAEQQQHRVDWVRSEIQKIEAEQKAARRPLYNMRVWKHI